jgi:hypothetical protein
MNEGVVHLDKLNLTEAELTAQAALVKAARAEWQLNWNALHPDKVLAKHKKFRETHQEVRSAYSKSYHKTDAGKARYERNKIWRQKVIDAKTHYCRPCDRAFWCDSHLKRHCRRRPHRETMEALKLRAAAAKFFKPTKTSTAPTA